MWAALVRRNESKRYGGWLVQVSLQSTVGEGELVETRRKSLEQVHCCVVGEVALGAPWNDFGERSQAIIHASVRFTLSYLFMCL